MVQDHVGMQLLTDEFRIFQLPLRDIVDKLMHLIRINHVVHKRFINGTEVVSLFEKTRRYENALVTLVVIGFRHLFTVNVPFFLWKVEGRCMNILLPVLDVLYNDLVIGMDRKTAGSFREKILEKGNLEDADILYRNFRGRDPKPEALLIRDGLTRPLRK